MKTEGKDELRTYIRLSNQRRNELVRASNQFMVSTKTVYRQKIGTFCKLVERRCTDTRYPTKFSWLVQK